MTVCRQQIEGAIIIEVAIELEEKSIVGKGENNGY